MHKILLFSGLISGIIFPSEFPKNYLSFPLDIKKIILTLVFDRRWLDSNRVFTSLNRVNKEWHTALGNPDVFKLMVMGLAERANGYSQLRIAKGMSNMAAYQHQEIQQWVAMLAQKEKVEKLLFQATENNNVIEIKNLITQQKVDIDGRDADGKTSLFIAARLNRLEALCTLLALGARVDLPCKYGCTPLKRAAAKGHLEVVEALLKHNADPDHNADEGYTALNNAAFGGYEQVCKMLIAAHANLDIQAHNGTTALIEAVSNGKNNIAKILLKAGARTDLQNREGFTALKIAQRRKNVELIQMLEENDQKKQELEYQNVK